MNCNRKSTSFCSAQSPAAPGRAGNAGKLMQLDSDLAETVMLAMQMAGIVVLPVHDSFLVQKSKASQLEETMLRVAYEAGYESLKTDWVRIGDNLH